MNQMIDIPAAGPAPAGNGNALPVYLSAIDAEIFLTLDLTLAFLSERRSIAIRMEKPTDSIDAEMAATRQRMEALKNGDRSWL